MVYHSDRFTLVDPISGKLINYGDKIIYGDENNEGAFDFFYGGANPLLVSESEKGVTVKITDKQRDVIYKYLSQFIKDYSEQCYERAKECSHLFGESTFDKIDLVEFALNYHLAYIGFNDLFEGDSKFYKSPQDALKRFKEVQGSGVSYGVTDYNILKSNFQAWSKCNGKIWEGLLRRRNSEFNLFVYGDYTGNN